MVGIYRQWKNLALSAVVVCGLTGFSAAGQPRYDDDGHSTATIRSAQQQLKDGGYYAGTIDGIDGPSTHEAIRRYQRDHHLAVNGDLDRETRHRLGVSDTGEANRSADNGGPVEVSRASVSAAQRALHRKGFYKGSIDGVLGAETTAALREYQRNSNLVVTGRLDQATMSGLGVAK